MNIGTKSLLYGYHQFILHPLIVAACWTRLYGFPFDPRLWVCFVVHDWGYWGKPNLDGPEGETHVELGARIMARLFDDSPLATVMDICFGFRPQGSSWKVFSLYHSRFYARRDKVEPSRLCYADKAAIAWTPSVVQLTLMRFTGEWKEYVLGHNGRTPANPGDSLETWCGKMRAVCREIIVGQKTEKPLAYYLQRNEMFAGLAVVGWWLVIFLLLAIIILRT